MWLVSMPILPTPRHPKVGEVRCSHLLSSYSCPHPNLASQIPAAATEHTQILFKEEHWYRHLVFYLRLTVPAIGIAAYIFFILGCCVV